MLTLYSSRSGAIGRAGLDWSRNSAGWNERESINTNVPPEEGAVLGFSAWEALKKMVIGDG